MLKAGTLLFTIHYCLILLRVFVSTKTVVWVRSGELMRCSHVAGRRGARWHSAAPHCRCGVVAPARHVWNDFGVLFKKDIEYVHDTHL